MAASSVHWRVFFKRCEDVPMNIFCYWFGFNAWTWKLLRSIKAFSLIFWYGTKRFSSFMGGKISHFFEEMWSNSSSTLNVVYMKHLLKRRIKRLSFYNWLLSTIYNHTIVMFVVFCDFFVTICAFLDCDVLLVCYFTSTSQLSYACATF